MNCLVFYGKGRATYSYSDLNDEYTFTNLGNEKGQIKTITNNVIFPVIDVVLAILLFVRIAILYMDYRKRGDPEWTPVAILFGCLLFSLTAPLYVWSIVNI